MYKATLIYYMNVVKNVPMCHASDSKGSQSHNIQAYGLVYIEIVANERVYQASEHACRCYVHYSQWHPLLGFGGTKLYILTVARLSGSRAAQIA